MTVPSYPLACYLVCMYAEVQSIVAVDLEITLAHLRPSQQTYQSFSVYLSKMQVRCVANMFV